MEGFLEDSTEHNLGFAEKNFETKRRDFMRFLDRVKAQFGGTSTVYVGAESQRLLQELRRYAATWLKTFAECSIDPVRAPKLVVTSEELELCASVGELCELCV